MKNLAFWLTGLFLFAFAVTAIAYDHPGGMHPKAQLDFVKKKIKAKEQPYYDAYHQLITYADSAFLHEKHALADFNVPGYYVDAVTHRKNSAGFQSDAFDAYACALAYQLSGQKKYATRSLEYLKAWADLNTQFSNADGSLVMAYSGTAMIMAAELLIPYKGWSKTDKQQFFGWVKNVYRKAADQIRNRKNNWADWGRMGSILSAYLLDDTLEVKENIRLVKSDLFHKIDEDGHMPEETRREANGLWYTYFSLAPITATCWIAYNATGENLFTYAEGQRSLKSALDYLYYFNQHPTEWKWYAKVRPGTPTTWPGNLLEAMAPIYADDRFMTFVIPARPLIYSKHHFAWTFPTLMRVQLTGYK